MYANTDEECLFCPNTGGFKDLQKFGLDKRPSARLEDIIEVAKIIRDEQKTKLKKYLDKKVPCGQNNCRCLSLLITGGGLYDRKKEADRYIRIIEAVRKAVPELTIHVECQSMEEEDSKRLAEAGLHSVNYNLEVWDKKMFEIVCPGKAKYVGYERWLEGLVRAVPHFERGHVISNQVIGCEMIPPHGFKTYQEALKSNLEGLEWMARRGIAPSWSPLFTYTSSKSKDASLPPTEYFIELGLEAHKIYLKYDLYTPTRAFFCYRMGVPSLSGDFARLRWDGELRYNEYCAKSNH